jgi:hypothetical protein
MITAKELIAKLQCQPPDSLVFILDVDGCQVDIVEITTDTQEDCDGDIHDVVYINTDA